MPSEKQNGAPTPTDNADKPTFANMSNADILRQPLTLPCGKVVPNRLVKAAMYEALCSFGGGVPNEQHLRLYEAWSAGGWGMVVTGNVFVDPRYQALGQDLIIPPPSQYPAYARLAQAIHSPSSCPRPLAILQLNHAGRQSMRGNLRPPWSPALAPSSIPMNSHEGWLATLAYRVFYGVPREMTEREIRKVVEQFTEGARMACETGWDGVEVHCAHGYLLSTFLSPRTNHRTDAYGSTPSARLLILLQIIRSIRSTIPSSFCVGVKLNSRDLSKGGLSEEEALDQVRALAREGGVDYIAVSGGTYEEVSFMGPSSRAEDKPFFERFAQLASAALADMPNAPKLILTGNLRSRSQCAQVIEEHTADLCGLARPAAVDPSFAAKLLDETVPDEEAKAPEYSVNPGPLVDNLPVKVVGASAVSMWHSWQLARTARGLKVDVRTGFWPLTVKHVLHSRDFWKFVAFVVVLVILGRRVGRRERGGEGYHV